MFPVDLDGAKVLYYTPKGNYGTIKYPNGEIADDYHYLAICQYPEDSHYYLFGCNENYEVVSDWVDSSIANCMQNADPAHTGNIIWIKT